MFRRRNPLPFFAKVRTFFWPSSGLIRSTKYLLFRLVRISGSPWAIAAGFACGAAVSFTPFVGFHILLSMAAAYLIRASLFSAVIGTVVGNPWTFPFIWVSIFHLGNKILLDGSESAVKELDFATLFQNLSQSVIELDIHLFAQEVWPIWFPMFIGSLPIAIFVWFVFYFPLCRFVSNHHIIRAEKREAAAQRREALLAVEQEKLTEKYEQMQKELAKEQEIEQEELKEKIEKQIEKQHHKFDKDKLKLEAKINKKQVSIDVKVHKLEKQLEKKEK